jgi:hypothetical protein
MSNLIIHNIVASGLINPINLESVFKIRQNNFR